MNLKQAASHLGIHYQTAYKLVRSGALAAVRVGGTYEISEASLERYLASRQAVQRGRIAERSDTAPIAPADAREQVLNDLASAARTATITPRGTYVTAAHGLASVLRDSCIVWMLAPEGRTLDPVAYDHWDPRRRSLLATYLEHVPVDVQEGFVGHVFVSGRRLFAPHVPQDVLRAGTRAEFVQYLDETPIHSMMIAPVFVADEIAGMIEVNRDASPVPFSVDDLALLQEAARLTGLAIERSTLARDAWSRRDQLLRALRAGAELESHGHEDSRIEVVLDAESRIRTANAAAEHFLGSNPGVVARELVDGTSTPETITVTERLRSGELDFHNDEITVEGANGESRRFLVLRGVARAETLDVIGTVVVAQPIAEVEVQWPVPTERTGRNYLDALPGRIVPHGSRHGASHAA